MPTPKRITTRSNSNDYDNVAALLVKIKNEIIEATKQEVKAVLDKLSSLEMRIDNLE